MPKITLYRQLRMDGGVRTGIEVDENIVYGLFEQGETDDDPRLRWFVDLRCDGPKLPETPRGARRWFLDHTGAIREGFARCAEEIQAGIDSNSFPVAWEDFQNLPDGVRAKIVLTAIRRVDAIEMSGILREIGSNWGTIIRKLKPAETAFHT